MNITEFYKYKQGRPYSSPFANPLGGNIITGSVGLYHIASDLSNVLYWLNGTIDGGELGGLSQAMDYMDIPLDGGALG
jgi:hypothetical protein